MVDWLMVIMWLLLESWQRGDGLANKYTKYFSFYPSWEIIIFWRGNLLATSKLLSYGFDFFNLANFLLYLTLKVEEDEMKIYVSRYMKEKLY